MNNFSDVPFIGVCTVLTGVVQLKMCVAEALVCQIRNNSYILSRANSYLMKTTIITAAMEWPISASLSREAVRSELSSLLA